MKIVILADMIPNKKFPLASVFPIDLAKLLLKSGVEVSLFFLNNYSIKTNKSIHLKKFNHFGIPSYSISFPIGRSFHLITRISSFIMLRILFKFYLRFSEAPQLIHAHFFEMGQSLYALKGIYKGKTILTEHSYQFGNNQRYSNDHLKKVYSSVDQLTVVSSFLSNEINNRLALTATIVPNFFNEDIFKFSKRTIGSVFNIVSVVNLVPVKNIELMMESFLLFSRTQNAILYIIGDGPLRKKFELYIKTNLIKNIIFLGYKKQSEISLIFKDSHVGLLTSKIETFNIFLIEALATGIPVVTTNCGGPRDFLTNSNGIMTDNNNKPSDIADSLKHIFTNYNSYDNKTISKDINEKFSSSSILKKWINLYDTLL
jgi:glycosyltransferase involved in cell wall biosynthesis